MRLNALDGLAGVRPNLDLSVLTSRVAPALLVEADTGEESGSVRSAHHTRLLEPLGHVGRVPEGDLFGCHRGKS